MESIFVLGILGISIVVLNQANYKLTFQFARTQEPETQEPKSVKSSERKILEASAAVGATLGTAILMEVARKKNRQERYEKNRYVFLDSTF